MRRLFFFQAEDGIRDDLVTGVQTCALPIWLRRRESTPGSNRATGGPGADGRRRERAASRGPGAYSCGLWLAIIVDAPHGDAGRQWACVKQIELAFPSREGVGDGAVTER